MELTAQAVIGFPRRPFYSVTDKEESSLWENDKLAGEEMGTVECTQASGQGKAGKLKKKWKVKWYKGH